MTFNDFMIENFNTESMSTFWDDFGIADKFGDNAIKDTYKRVKKEWLSNVKMWTELAIVLNTRCWQHYDNHNNHLSEIYAGLYENAINAGYENFKDEDASYFYRMID